MKERPILFSAAMVRAILEGRKTQTRRLLKGNQIPKENPVSDHPLRWTAVGQHDRQHGFIISGDSEDDCARNLAKYGVCQYGKVGDQLWVREAFAWSEIAADHEEVLWRADSEYSLDERGGSRWRPSIHMPRWASRITLEITSIKVERLQDISKEDAIAEGCSGGHNSIPGYIYNATPTEHFMWLWESIHGEGAWAVNPWNWAVTFKRVSP